MKTSVDESKKFSSIPKNKNSRNCCCDYAKVGQKSMQIFNSVDISVIIAPPNVFTPHISKTHLPLVSLMSMYLNYMYMYKYILHILGTPSHPGKPYYLLSRAPTLHGGMCLPNAVQSK